MKLGIVGLPNVGKSTLFNLLTQAGADVANYAFCTIDPNVGIVHVPDERLDFLTELYKPEKTVSATIEFVDIAGLVRGASKGEGLGNQFLATIREVDAICHVVRCFEDRNVIHVDGAPDPRRDIETINLELIFADLDHLERRIEKTQRLAKGGDKKYGAELAFYDQLKQHLLDGKPARLYDKTDEECTWFRELSLLTNKPVLYVANVSEDEIGVASEHVRSVAEIAGNEQAEMVIISAKIEEELSALDTEERELFLTDLGIKSTGLERLIQASYRLLGLISFLTIGSDEVRAWTIKEGTRAPQAAGKIHTDFERGFIRAEVVAFDALKALGSMPAAREKGLVRSEGKEYIVKDGDVIHFRFNV